MKLRKALVSIIIVISIFSLTLSSSALVALGDANNDGTINSLDSVLLSRYIANWTGYDENTATVSVLDINGDATVNSLDSVILSRHLASWTGYNNLSSFNPTYGREDSDKVAPVTAIQFAHTGMYLKIKFTVPTDTTGISGYEMYIYEDAKKDESIQHMPIGFSNNEYQAYFLLDSLLKRYSYDKLDVVSLTDDPNYQSNRVTFDIDIDFLGELSPEFTVSLTNNKPNDDLAAVSFDYSGTVFAQTEFYESKETGFVYIDESYSYVTNGRSTFLACDNAQALASENKLYAKITGFDVSIDSGTNTMTWKKIQSGYIAISPYEE